MTSWTDFTAGAPRISAIFTRRHAATGKLCLLATLRADGSPRISPIEPRVFEDRLWLIGMPDTTKFRDLHRDPRFCLHTATVDTQVGEGDAKLFGTVADVRDTDLHQRFAQDLFEEIGFDLRGETFGHFYEAHLTGASSVEIVDGHMEVGIWKPGEQERVVQKT
ncbi:pyridoxamine 5'-phosphate oxidase family protein [Pseudonocardia abyssalis]|uniref:Pyridoxamine 5'-phosphate oxidase family protein n=1 Tax=Pseudonocardia abyssalis TaxID=2792008 RepID=A0ABS6UWR5_9PSEU|nr:pyridoxamine 5'-phosphate oxidase family protein [Pseudonocardia abyssalis]MBW0114694.1 pyridoxamine 5'-phosphate oxidase family protein [Pseudonocardia abyssalis]MBW0136689.1 pyridoxamine 5'-phosphate oxidase family protein [Pseudonocardia abyssalis]